MQQNKYLLASFGTEITENSQNFPKNLTTFLAGPRGPQGTPDHDRGAERALRPREAADLDHPAHFHGASKVHEYSEVFGEVLLPELRRSGEMSIPG